jgi:UDP-N-acetylmuramate--alanine ligase
MSSKKSIHFIGIGGIGMSALARYFKASGYAISGSDSARGTITDSLLKERIKVKIGHKKGILPKNDTYLVIYNRAIPADNTELVYAKAQSIPVVPYAKILGYLTEQYRTIAVTGSHGKSTTTSLAGLALIHGGMDPTVLVGTNLKEFQGKNIRIGRSPYLVLEADDFGAAFLDYSPAISVVTNIDKEHMDFYKTFAAVKSAFLKFMERTQDGGALILNRDDKALYSLKSRVGLIAKKKKLNVVWYSIKNNASAAALKKLKKVIAIPGEHNLSNAMAVLELGKLLKIHERKTLEAIAAYRGAWRRMEYRGKFFAPRGTSSALVYDDYAHHPTEIKATLQGFKEKFPRTPVICVFQPHQTKRLEALFKEFISAFTAADILILIPSYNVAGRDESNSKFTANRLASTIAKKYPHKKIYYLENPKHIKKILTRLLPSSAVVVMMGAGDIVQYTDLLLT